MVYCIFDSSIGGPDKFILSVRLFFLLKGIDLFYTIWFDWFLLHEEYGIGLNVDFPCRSTS